MAIYLVEHKVYSDNNRGKGWKLKRRFDNKEEAYDFYNKMKGLRARASVPILYRVVRLVS